MTAPTHIAFGLLTVAGSFSFFSMPLHRNLPAIAGAIIGSVLPDIDSPRSYIGRVLPYASIPIERQWGHRTITHSLLCLLALSVMTWPLLIWQTPCYVAIILGYSGFSPSFKIYQNAKKNYQRKCGEFVKNWKPKKWLIRPFTTSNWSEWNKNLQKKRKKSKH